MKVLVTVFALIASLFVLVTCLEAQSPKREPAALTGALLLPDGRQVTTSGLISKIDPRYIVLRDPDNEGHLIIPLASTLGFFDGQPLDASGILATQRNGFRYLKNAQLSLWTDAAGSVIPFPVPFLMGRNPGQPFIGRKTLIPTASTGTASSQMSLMSGGVPEPTPTPPLLIFCDTLQIAVDQATDTNVELHSRAVTSVGSGSFVLGENANSTISPTQSLSSNYTGTVAGSARVMQVTGVLHKATGQTTVLNIDSGPGFDSNGFHGGVLAVLPGAIAYAKSLPDDEEVSLGTSSQGKVITRVLGTGVFYVEEDDRSSGIRVAKVSHGRVAGERTYVEGTMKTSSDHERYIDASQVSQAGSGLLQPLFMTNRSLGGGPYFTNDGPPHAGQDGITGASGLNNIGLLVRVSGKVTQIDTASPPTWFTLDDGSVDGGVTVDLVPASGTTIPLAADVDDYVTVKAISSCQLSGSDLVRRLRPGSLGPLTFSPAAGDYCSCQHVRILAPAPDVTILYTLDGSTPSETNSAARVYDPRGRVIVPIPEYGSTTLKAVALDGGWAATSTYSAVYSYGEECGGGGGGDPTNYTCYKYNDEDPPDVQSLVVSGIYQPHTVCLAWGNSIGDFEVRRQPWSETLQPWADADLVGQGSERSVCDESDFTSGAKLAYAVRVTPWTEPLPDNWLSLPLCTHTENDPNCHPFPRRGWQSASDWRAISITPVRVLASDNVSVDSRLDTRETDVVFLDHQFGSTTFRGGLFVGNPGSGDGSGVARSFLKFDVTPPAFGGNEAVWAASLNTFYTGALSETTTSTIGCHAVTSDSWSADSLNWTNAPTLNAATPLDSVVVGPQAITPMSWCHWDSSLHEILVEMRGDEALSVGLASTAEDEQGWAYMAKKEYDSALGPQVLYAYGTDADGHAPCFPVKIVLSGNSVKGGLTLTGRVYLNTPAPSGGRAVSLAVTPACVASVSSLTVPAGQISAGFVISTAIVSTNTDATAVAGGNGYSCRAGFQITP